MVTLWSSQSSEIEVARLIELDEIAALVDLFEEVVEEKGWQSGNALDCDRHRSVYLGLVVQGEIAGGMQIVLPGGECGFSCQSVWPEVEVVPIGRCAHIELMAVDRTVRGAGCLFWHLAAEMWRFCLSEGITRLFIEANPRNYAVYTRMGWPLKIVGEARLHWGAITYLCTLEIAEVAESILRRVEGSEQYRDVASQAFRVSIRRKLSRRARRGMSSPSPLTMTEA